MEVHATEYETLYTPIQTKMHVLIITDCYPTKQCSYVSIEGRHVINSIARKSTKDGQCNNQKRNTYSKILDHITLLEN